MDSLDGVHKGRKIEANGFFRDATGSWKGSRGRFFAELHGGLGIMIQEKGTAVPVVEGGGVERGLVRSKICHHRRDACAPFENAGACGDGQM